MDKQIPEGWTHDKLGKCLREVKERKGSNEALPVLSVTNTQGFVLSEDFFDRKVYSKNLDNYKIVRRGQFAYNPSRLNVGSLAHLKEFEAGLLSPMYVVFEALSEIDSDFLGCWLTSGRTKNLIKSSTQGTVRDSVNFSALSAFPIDLPPYFEQEKIAAILGSVDRAIEKTRAVIDQTRRLKKAMMQELLTRGIPGRHKRFKKTPIGEVPEDWEVVKLVEILRETIKNGYSPNCPDKPTGHWMLGLGAVTFEGIDPSAVKPAPNNDEKIHDFVLENGDVLVSRSNTRERVGLAGTYIGNPANCSYPDLLMRLRARTDIVSPLWVEKCLLSNKGRTYFEREARGTSASMVKINKAILNSFPLALPSYEEQKNILQYLSKIERCMEEELSTLKQFNLIKTALMQILLTGEVRVKT